MQVDNQVVVQTGTQIETPDVSNIMTNGDVKMQDCNHDNSVNGTKEPSATTSACNATNNATNQIVVPNAIEEDHATRPSSVDNEQIQIMSNPQMIL